MQVAFRSDRLYCKVIFPCKMPDRSTVTKGISCFRCIVGNTSQSWPAVQCTLLCFHASWPNRKLYHVVDKFLAPDRSINNTNISSMLKEGNVVVDLCHTRTASFNPLCKCIEVMRAFGCVSLPVKGQTICWDFYKWIQACDDSLSWLRNQMLSEILTKVSGSNKQLFKHLGCVK